MKQFAKMPERGKSMNKGRTPTKVAAKRENKVIGKNVLDDKSKQKPKSGKSANNLNATTVSVTENDNNKT